MGHPYLQFMVSTSSAPPFSSYTIGRWKKRIQMVCGSERRRRSKKRQKKAELSNRPMMRGVHHLFVLLSRRG